MAEQSVNCLLGLFPCILLLVNISSAQAVGNAQRFQHSDVVRMSIVEATKAERVPRLSHHDKAGKRSNQLFNMEQPRTGSTFTLAKIFQDNMVLQKAPARANIFGFSSELGQKVIGQMTTPSQNFYYATTVQPGPSLGTWSFSLDPVDANTTVSISIFSEVGSLSLSNIIFGDVWLCSGQSNMQFTVIQMLGAEQELADAINYPHIRIMTVAEYQSSSPLYDVNSIQQHWTTPSNASLGGAAWSYFSAVCWLYGKAIHKALNYPIGLVATDWGGTPVEAWSSPDALSQCHVTAESGGGSQEQSFSRYLDTLPPKVRARLQGPSSNSVLWNAMIHPLLEMTIYGAIWYQGENDASGAMMNRYNCTFPAMIRDWRQKFHAVSHRQTNDIFPFGFVQLAPNSPDPSISVGFPDIRFHQTADWGYTPNKDMPSVFMAVAMDLPDFNSTYGSIHPQDKLDVGDRLSLAGLAVAYGRPGIFQGPFPARGDFLAEGLVLQYGDTWSLQIRNTEGFEVQCLNEPTIHWVPTSIISSGLTNITLQSTVCNQNERIVGLRYAWRESPCAFKKCAVYESSLGLPGATFIVLNYQSPNRSPYFVFEKPTTF